MLEIREFPLATEELRCNGPQAMELYTIKEDYDPSAIEAFSEALENNSTLTYLKISNPKLDDRGAAALAKAFKQNNVLTYLDLYISFTNGHDADNTNCISIITAALEENKVLTSLKFNTSPSPTDAIVKAFAAMLKKNTSLTSLDFGHWNSSRGSTTEGYKDIVKALETNSTLTTITIASRNISAESIQAFSKMLEKNTTLASLSISAVFIDSNGTLLAKTLEKNNTLTSVELGNARIDDESVKAFSEMLKNNTTLTSFKLGGFYTDKDELNQSIIAIMEALEENNSLISIDLSLAKFHNDTQINSSGAQAIAKMLEKNRTLTSIKFNTKIITQDTLSKIANALEKNTTLFSIDDQIINLSPQIGAAIHRNKKINGLTNSALASLHTILYLNECPNTEKEFNEISEKYLNTDKILNEIKKLHPTASQLDQIQEIRLKIAAKHPWLIEPEVAFELFEALNEAQKISDKSQDLLEIIALSYYAEIRKEADYSHEKLLRFIMKNWSKDNNKQIEHLLHQCLYACLNGEAMQTPSLAIEPEFILKAIVIHKDEIPALLQKIPGVDKLIEKIMYDIKEPDAETAEMLASVTKTIRTAGLVMDKLALKTHEDKFHCVLREIPEASLIINKKIHKNEELNQFIESISKIKSYSKTLAQASSQLAKNKATALIKIVQTYQAYSGAKEPLTKTLDAVKHVVAQNKETIRQHRHWSVFSCFFPLFKSRLEKRVTSYKLVTDLEKHIENLQDKSFLQGMVK